MAFPPSPPPSVPPLTVHLEFSGGLELLFDGAKRLSLTPSPAPPLPLAALIDWVARERLTARHELFSTEKGRVRPGILVLVNEVDWELEGEGEYVVKAGDTITFISTLHGG